MQYQAYHKTLEASLITSSQPSHYCIQKEKEMNPEKTILQTAHVALLQERRLPFIDIHGKEQEESKARLKDMFKDAQVETASTPNPIRR